MAATIDPERHTEPVGWECQVQRPAEARGSGRWPGVWRTCAWVCQAPGGASLPRVLRALRHLGFAPVSDPAIHPAVRTRHRPPAHPLDHAHCTVLHISEGAGQDMPPVPGVILVGDRFTAGGWVSGNPALTMSRENSSTGAPRPPVDLRYIHVSALMSATLRLPSSPW